MGEHQSGRPTSSAPPSENSDKADSKLRHEGKDGQVVVPDEARPNDSTPTIISKIAPKSLADAITGSDNLNAKNLYGQRLAHFELLEPIGVGGMAAVLRARDTLLDRIVALKILPPETAHDQENVHRFHQEARAAAKLDHPNIAQVFFCGDDRGLHFIAFEFVEGENLRTLVEKHRRLPVAEAVRYIIQIATGLDHAASRGVVHRDIKPSNIIITPNGAAKLVDMGLARSLEPQGDKGLTHSGMTLGTFDYISPEQALEPRTADVRSDIYSLGCTFYHMLTGHAPVPEGTAAKKLYHHQHVAPIDPRQLNADISDEIAAILMRMMCKDPAGRYQRPAQLVQHLMQVAEKVGAGAGAPQGAMFLDAPLPSAPRFRPLLTITLAGLALGALLILIQLAPSPKGSGLMGQLGGSNTKIVRPPDDPPKPPLNPPGPIFTISNGEQFIQALKQGHQTAKIDQDITLNTGGMNFDFDAKKNLVIKSADGRPVRLRFDYRPTNGEDATACLNLNLQAGCSVEFQNIRFELEYNNTGIPEAMIAVSGPGRAKFTKCTFVVTRFPHEQPVLEADGNYFFQPKGSRLVASLLVNGEVNGKSLVSCVDCFWEHGQAGVAIEGPVRFDANDCAFGLHHAQFHLRGNCPKNEVTQSPLSEISLQHCSFFVANGPAFRIDNTYFLALNVNYSIFSNPEAAPDAHFIRQMDKNEGLLVKYIGNRNVYHKLTSFWAADGYPKPSMTTPSHGDFGYYLTPLKGDDSTSKVVTVDPWAAKDPLRELRAGYPRQAFQVRQNLKEVRIDPFSLRKAVGIEKCAWGKQDEMIPWTSIENPAPLIPLASNQKVVDPDANEKSPAGVYPNLLVALANLPQGGELFIKRGKNSRDVPMEGLEHAAGNLLLKPYPGHEPVLVFSDKSLSPWFIRQRSSGMLQFEKLEFLLDPENLVIKSQKVLSIVALASGGQCIFKNCVFTMKRPADRGVQMNVVNFQDVNFEEDMKDMAKNPPKDMAQVRFSDCLVRGDGDLIRIRNNRPLDLQIDNTLLALNGSAMVLHGVGKNANANPDLRTYVKLSRVSAFLTEPFIRGKRLDGLAPVVCDAKLDNLFVSLASFVSSSSQPFVSLEIDDPDNDLQRGMVRWEGQKNVYVKYDVLAEYRKSDDISVSQSLDKDEWGTFHDRSARFLFDVDFSIPAVPVFSDLNLSHFKTRRMMQELVNHGARLEGKLPPYTSPRVSKN